MKKLLFAALLLTVGLVGKAHAVCDPRNTTCMTSIDVSGTATVAVLNVTGVTTMTSPVTLYTRTLAQMNLLAPSAVGQLIYVSDAVQSRVCSSSGTAAGAWVVSTASGTFVGGSYPHCN